MRRSRGPPVAPRRWGARCERVARRVGMGGIPGIVSPTLAPANDRRPSRGRMLAAFGTPARSPLSTTCLRTLDERLDGQGRGHRLQLPPSLLARLKIRDVATSRRRPAGQRPRFLPRGSCRRSLPCAVLRWGRVAHRPERPAAGDPRPSAPAPADRRRGRRRRAARRPDCHRPSGSSLHGEEVGRGRAALSRGRFAAVPTRRDAHRGCASGVARCRCLAGHGHGSLTAASVRPTLRYRRRRAV